MRCKFLFPLLLILCFHAAVSFSQKSSLNFTVSMENPEWHIFHVEFSCTGIQKEHIDFKMPVWTPGYYQKMDYAKNVTAFSAKDGYGNVLKWEKINDNTWRVYTQQSKLVLLGYDVKALRAFVATPYLDENRGYIVPAGVFLHIDKMIRHPVQVKLIIPEKWNRVATGLDSVSGKKYTYTAPDFDILYDCPLLAGNLEELPAFKIRGITHRFLGYKLGNFNREQFILDLKKIVDAAVTMIGHMPYRQYTFIAIGPGAGGIEHLNNTTFGFNGNSLHNRDGYIRTLHFLAHEYFHHYNVKRIRPIELGPFDYDKGNQTKLLWFSEGLTVYYEYLLVRRAGITTHEELFKAISNNIAAFENGIGKQFQTLEQASFDTWSDGPFGRTGDEVNKTISYYDKGPVVGMLFDLKIREITKNKKSLDDVMRLLYMEYYQKKKRGFTDNELRQAFESIAGSPLADEFAYVTTTKALDYPTYLAYAGLIIDTTAHELPGAYTGFTIRYKEDSLFIATTEYESPAWNAGIRPGQQLLQLNRSRADSSLWKKIIAEARPGDSLKVKINSANTVKEIQFVLGVKRQKKFTILAAPDPTPSQKQIREAWLKG